ncbi:hypothetical protein FBU30_000615 [Linnemannia zychae]|nr:hypothetical protein FBU30_000615 [Linnemannia zychae]
MDPHVHSRNPSQLCIDTLPSDTPMLSYQPSPADNQNAGSQQEQQLQQQQNLCEQHSSSTVRNEVGNSEISTVSDFAGVAPPPRLHFHSTTIGSSSPASSAFHDSVRLQYALPISSSSSITAPVPSATVTTVAPTISSSNQSSSFMDSIFKKKHHRRRSSSVLGWDSDDDEVLDRTTVAPSENTSSQNRNSCEKSAWLQREHGKQRRVRTCICVGVVVCFIAVGAVLAFTFKEQWTHQSAKPIIPHPKNMLKPIPVGGNPREQLRQTIESTFHVNTTIIPDSSLHKVFYGIDYTPRGSQEPDCRVNLGNVIEDIKILSQLTNRIRLYGMACRQTEDVMKAIQYLDLPDMQLIITLWVDSNKASWKKQTQMFWDLIDNNLIMDASTTTEDMVREQGASSLDTITITKIASRIIGISVGNEVLFRNEDKSKPDEYVPLELLDSYINEIRNGLKDRATTAAASPNPIYSALGQQLAHIPVFSSDLGRNAYQIVDKVDWIMSNIHPFFAYTSANRAANWAFVNFQNETVEAAGGKPAMISEVGWPSGPSSAALGPAVPSPENLQIFVNTWVCQANLRNVPYYYFEAFDEPWKNSINPRESQWGLMTVDRRLKVTIPNC